MAAPAVAASLAAQGTITTLTPTLATHASGDLLLLVLFDAAQAMSLTTANGWSVFSGAGVLTSNAAGADSAGLAVYYKVAASSSETAPLIADPGNHLGCISLTITGADTNTANWVVSADVDSTAAATAVTMPSVTTASADNLILLLCATGHDQTTASLTSLTNATISPIESASSGVTDGGGSVCNIFKGTMATAGATGTSTGTLSVGSRQARATIAFPPSSSGITGTATIAVPVPTVASTGKVAISATASIAVPVPTASATGRLAIAAAATIAVPVPTASATSRLAITGTATIAVPVPTSSGSSTIGEPAPAPTATTAGELRALLIANIEAIASTSPRFRAHRHDLAPLEDWAPKNPGACLRRFSVRDELFDRAEFYSGADREQRRVQFRIMVAYPQDHRAGTGGAVGRDEMLRRDRHALDVATGLRAYESLETLPAYFVSSSARVVALEGVEFLIVDAVYEFTRLTS